MLRRSLAILIVLNAFFFASAFASEVETAGKPLHHKQLLKSKKKKSATPIHHGECWGFHGSCSEHSSSQSNCNDQVGCTWNGNSCGGSSFSCSDAETEYQCAQQSGCHWDN